MSQLQEQVYRHATYTSLKSWRERHGRYRLVGSRCAGCGTTYFPRRSACARCHGRTLEPYECAHTGTVVVMWAQLPIVRLLGYADLPQRFVGIVRLDDGTHVETEIAEVTRAQVNDPVRVGLVFRRLRRESNGNWLYGYKFAALPEPAAHNGAGESGPAVDGAPGPDPAVAADDAR
jgi:uncharacterized OB-fold protein